MSKAPTPSYSKAKPPRRDGEFEQPTHEIGGDIIIQGNGAGSTEILAGDSILVEDLSDSVTDRFRVSYAPYIAASTELIVIAKEVGVTRSNPILKGTVIDEADLSWVNNKVMASQALNNNVSLVPPSLSPGDTSFNYTIQNIQNNSIFTITVNDGEGLPGSIAIDTVSIIFGNNFIIGNDISRDGLSASSAITMANGMTKMVKTNRLQTYFATGGVNQHHYVIYPKAWGLGTFTKGIFTGGYVRLKNVSGVMKSVLEGGDMEIDFLLTNSKGYQEAYYIYMSLFDNQADPITQFLIS